VLHLDTTTAQPYRELSVEEVEAADALANNNDNYDDNNGDNSNGDSGHSNSNSAAQTGTAAE
jgi:hypothetical protein